MAILLKSKNVTVKCDNFGFNKLRVKVNELWKINYPFSYKASV